MDILFAFPGYESLRDEIVNHLEVVTGSVVIRHFPDGESFVRLNTDVKNKDIAVVCGLDRPDQKAMALMFFAAVAKELGARKVGLIAPYLGYMRQDKRFHEWEAITSSSFARFISSHIDWLVTIDPHLHRYKSLSEIYTISTTVLHAADAIAKWINHNVQKPILIGPDKESEQWVARIAKKANAPFQVLTKIRHGDKQVEVSVPEAGQYMEHTPVLIDDIIATAQTMIKTVEHVHTLDMRAPVCIGIHAIFADNSYKALKDSGAGQIVTCNTIAHSSNAIDISNLIASGL